MTGKGLSNPTLTSCGHRRSPACFAAAVLLLPPLIVWLILAVLTLSHKQRPVNIGDPLLDAWLAASHPGVRSNDSDMIKLGLATECIGDDTWSGWERRFGSDSRFWVLRSH